MEEKQETKPQEQGKITVLNPNSMELDERIVKAFEKIAENTFLNIQKRDFRATMVHREERGEIPDSAAALIHIDETERDEVGNPVELDYKGHISQFEANHFKDVNYGMGLINLKKWAYFEQEVEHQDGTKTIEKIPMLLAQIDMLSKKRLNMAVGGSKSWMHIHERRANSGMPPQEVTRSNSGWFGLKKERIPKEELDAAYGRNDKQ